MGRFTSPLPPRVVRMETPLGAAKKNEEQLSQFQIPPNVQQAIEKSQSTGNPVGGIRADGPTYQIPVLVYHYVEHVKDPKDTIRMSLNIFPETLDRQIQTLKQAGYTFINASDLANILDGIESLPAKPVMLTFDDGYGDFYTGAFPVLEKENVKSVAYIVPGFLNKPNYLTDVQLKEIAKSGLVEIGAHTMHHLALAGLAPKIAKEEIDNSRTQLELKLDIPVTAFAYPYGSFDLETIKLVKQAGFRTAVSTVPGTQVANLSRFFIHRLHPGAASGQGLLSLVSKP